MAAQAAYYGTTDPTLPLPHQDFAGSVRIYIPHVYTTFWARLISTEEDLQEHMLGKLSRMRHTWEKFLQQHELLMNRLTQ